MNETIAVEDSQSCPECRTLLLENCRAKGISINEVKLVSKQWPRGVCPHGRTSIKFVVEIAVANRSEERFHKRTEFGLECEESTSVMDATKDIGYPVREHGPYGSHSIHDPFDDESGPNGQGIY